MSAETDALTAAPASAGFGEIIGTPQPIKVSIEPSEGDKVRYLRVAPPAKGEPAKAMLYFFLKITNNTSGVRTLDRITISFPGSTVKSRDFDRSVQIKPGATKTVWLTDAEKTQFTKVPPKLTVSLRFAEDQEHPFVGTWDLAPHDTSYSFFARPEEKTEDVDYGEYILLPGDHFGDGGDQTFGYDVNVLGRNYLSGKLSKSKTDEKTNEDRFAWERPVYAMADGLVLRAVSHQPDNPAPDKRRLVRKHGEYQGKDQIKAVSVAELSESKTGWFRMLVGSVTTSGLLKLTVLEQDRSGNELRFVSELDGPSADQVCVVGLGQGRACTVVQFGTNVDLILWSLSPDGKTITEVSKVTVPGIAAIKAVKLSKNRLLTAARTKAGKLSVSVWQIKDNAFLPDPEGKATGGPIGDFDIVALNEGRVAAAVQLGTGNLKIIVWDLEGGGGGGGGGGSDGTSIPPFSTIDLVRRGEVTTKGKVSEVAAVETPYSDHLATAVRTHEGTFALIIWDVDSDGTVMRRQTFTDPRPASSIGLSLFKEKQLAAAYRSDSGKLRIVDLVVEQDEKTHAVTVRQHDELETWGATDLYGMTRVGTPQPTIVTAVRTDSGVLKVILWQSSDSNHIYVLYGDELVLHAHFRENSIPAALRTPADGPDADLTPIPVKRGDLIGRIGNSGRSKGPHLHIQTMKIAPAVLNDLPGLMARLRAGEGDSVGVLRPLQFEGVLTMRKKGVKPGWKNNPLTKMQGQGAHFEEYVVWPWPGDFPG